MKEVQIGPCTLIQADCLEALPTIGGVHSCVTDPPYHLTSIVKRFGAENAAPAKVGKTGAYARASRGFMGTVWDGGDIAFRVATWELVSNALLPGAHLAAFSGSRTYHRMAVAIEDAGFEIRDQLMFLYGTGFPKSHDVSKSIDKAERGVPHGASDPTSPNHGKYRTQKTEGKRSEADVGQGYGAGGSRFLANGQHTQAARELSADAAAWEGWGTALKPAHEPIAFARKPLSESSIASNVLKHGTGAINVDAGRVAHNETCRPMKAQADGDLVFGQAGRRAETLELKEGGRWPANVITDGSLEVYELFPPSARDSIRFFYSAKVGSEERDGSTHPTMKPVDLMRWLCRLITPPGGIILDPFMGSGSTGIAAVREGFRFIGIEQSPEYFEIAARRIEAAVKQAEREPDLLRPKAETPKQMNLLEL